MKTMNIYNITIKQMFVLSLTSKPGILLMNGIIGMLGFKSSPVAKEKKNVVEEF